MPAVDTVLLPLCVGLTLLGVIATGIAWRRGNKGRVVQGVGLALAPVALYFSGLLRLLWNGVVAVGTWASRVILSPAVWVGLLLLALCVVLWVVGGFVARRTPKKVKASKTKAVAASPRPAAGQPAVRGTSAKQAPPVDDDMAEIEALLKSRGID
jgi:Na+-transporting methylmalonyl-CoA/oxaloacetate decarboxylase gamma subunit